MRAIFDELLLTNGLGLNTPKTFEQTEEILYELKERNIEFVGTSSFPRGGFSMEFWCKTKDALMELRKILASPNACDFPAKLFSILMQTKQKPELFLPRQQIEAVGKPNYILLLRKVGKPSTYFTHVGRLSFIFKHCFNEMS